MIMPLISGSARSISRSASDMMMMRENSPRSDISSVT
jgi:hypothetical protein